MPDATLLFAHRFDGPGYPTFATPWPGYAFDPAAAYSLPVVDGTGKGISNRTVRVNWIARSTAWPGRPNYKVDLWAKWENPGGAGDREVGNCARVKDWSNYLVARITPRIGLPPQLRLYKVIAGVETQLGSTYTGAPVTGTNMLAGLKWRIRVKDQADGDTRISVYTDPLGASGDGDLRIDVTTSIPQLRGLHTTGIELRGTKLTDVRVDDQECYDLSDEWTSATPPAPGSGWVAELNDDTYNMDELEALNMELVDCAQGFGVGGNTCNLKVKGQFQLGPIMPNMRCRIFHDGDVRFAGYLAKPKLRASVAEDQTWGGRDAMFQASLVEVRETDGSRNRIYNVRDTKSDDYRAERAGKTLGSIYTELFDEKTTPIEGLRYYGAVPPEGLAYVQSQANLLTAEIPGISVGGTFTQSILTLLSYMPKFQPWVHPETKVWHVLDITALQQEDIVLTTDHVKLTLSPDPDLSYTAVEFCGDLPEDKDDVTLTLNTINDSPNSDAQRDNWHKDKGKYRQITLDVLASAVAPFPPTDPDQPPNAIWFITVAAGKLQHDDWRGSVVGVTSDNHLRWCISNTSTTLWISAPGIGGGGPGPGDKVTLSLVHPDAIPYLSAAGVGRAMRIPPAQLCPSSGKAFDGFKNHGKCGSAIVKMIDADGREYFENRAYEVHQMNAAQAAAFNPDGSCSTAIVLNEPLPTINLVARPQDGKSPPTQKSFPPPGGGGGGCGTGDNFPSLDIEVTLSERELEAPCFRKPPNPGEWQGYAYSDEVSLWNGGGEAVEGRDWGVRRKLSIPFSEFRNTDDQKAGLEPAAQAMLDLFSGKQWKIQVTIATNWKAQGVIRPASSTSRWANLTKKISLSSTKRTTGLESVSTSNIPVYKVTWKVKGNQTILEAGTAAAWLGVDAQAATAPFTAKMAAEMMGRTLKEVEDYRSCMLAKPPMLDVQRTVVEGCDVKIVNENTKRQTNVNEDDQDKQAWINHGSLVGLAHSMLLEGLFRDDPGARVAIDGVLDGPSHQFPQDGGGSTLGSLASPHIAFMGPANVAQGDRGQFGGLPGSNEPGSFSPPDELFRLRGVIFRKMADKSGNREAAVGIEIQETDKAGAPSGPTHEFTSAATLKLFGLNARDLLNSGSVLHEHEQVVEHQVEDATLGTFDDDKLPVRPGTLGVTGYPDGTPPDLAAHLKAAYAHSLHLLQHTIEDPGGPVFEGPMSGRPDGANAGMFWRVMVPENTLVEVEAVAAGTGTNNGNYGWKDYGTGQYFELRRGSVETFHKQASDFEDLSGAFGAPPGSSFPFVGPDASNVWGMVGSRWEMAPSPAVSAVGAMFELPVDVRGAMTIGVMWRENPNAPLGPTLTQDFDLWTMLAMTPWLAPVLQTPAGPVSSVGGPGGQGQGQFTAPGGAVPAGLRVPYGPSMGVAVVGAATGGSMGGGTLIGGINVEVARVEGGYVIRVREGAVTTLETLQVNDLQTVESVDVGVAVAFDVEKVLAEAVSVAESDVSFELNPTFSDDEAVTITEQAATFELNP